MDKYLVDAIATIVLVILALILLGLAMWTEEEKWLVIVCAFLSGWLMRSARDGE